MENASNARKVLILVLMESRVYDHFKKNPTDTLVLILVLMESRVYSTTCGIAGVSTKS